MLHVWFSERAEEVLCFFAFFCDKQQLTLCVFNLGIRRVTAKRNSVAVVKRPLA